MRLGSPEPLPHLPPAPPSVCQFLSRCQSPQGGFGGGPGQDPHLAPTYAAVNALCIIGTEEAFGVINRYGRHLGGLGGSGWMARGWGGKTCVPPMQPPGFCRKKLLEYLHSLKQPDGSFLMHVGGEVDVRWVNAGRGTLGCHGGQLVMCGGPGATVGAWCCGSEHPPPAEVPTAPPPWPRSPTS